MLRGSPTITLSLKILIKKEPSLRPGRGPDNPLTPSKMKLSRINKNKIEESPWKGFQR